MCDELLAGAAVHTGHAEFDTQLSIGQSLSITETTEAAERVLTAVADDR